MTIFDMDFEAFADRIHHDYGKGSSAAADVYRNFYRSGRAGLDHLPPQLKHRSWLQEIKNRLMLPPAVIADQKCDDGVTKVIFRLSDGYHIETVIVPMDRYATVCVSCQVGCRMGCRFCETATIGFKRNLSASEIVYQVYAARRHLGVSVKNVVFMGMGEPLDNVDGVIKAIDVIKDQRGLNIAERNITLSTSGRIDGIHHLARLGRTQIRIAVSLNAPNDEVRSKIMPINRQYPMALLKDALLSYPLKPDNRIVIEYVLIDGMNDFASHADQLAGYLSGLPVKVNLIPCNPGPGSPYQPPPLEVIEAFRRRLVASRVFVRMRRTKGQGLMAACGQLGHGFDTGPARPSIQSGTLSVGADRPFTPTGHGFNARAHLQGSRSPQPHRPWPGAIPFD